MIRLILKRRVTDNISGYVAEDFYTLDIDVPEIEAALKSGGYGESGSDRTELVGVEVRSQP